MKLLNKILIAPAAAVVMLIVVATVGLAQLRGESQLLEDMSSRHLLARLQSNAIQFEVSDTRAEVHKLFSLASDYDEQRSIQPELDVLSKRFASVAEKFVGLAKLASTAEKDNLTTAAAAVDGYANTAMQALRMARGNHNTSLTLMIDAEEKYVIVKEQLSALIKKFIDRADQAMASVKAEAALAIVFIQISVVVAILLAAVIAWLTARNIVRRVDMAAASANRLCSGNLTSEFVLSGNDEVTNLSRNLEGMRQTLIKLIGEVQISAGAVNLASLEIVHGNNDLSTRTAKQAASLQQTATAVEQLSATVKQSADNARQAMQVALKASTVAEKGGAVVGQVVATMAEIQQASKRIADIIGVIDSIAFQTNILALNAAVEAARAGEQGRGFAVVASEVRTLAQRSALAAKEIKELIDDSVDKVNDGAKLVDHAGSTIGDVVLQVKRVTDLMNEISAATVEQSGGIDQVNHAVIQIDQMTLQNAALVEESTAAAASLQEQASSLNESIGVFKLSSEKVAPQAALDDRSAETMLQPQLQPPPHPFESPRPAAKKLSEFVSRAIKKTGVGKVPKTKTSPKSMELNRRTAALAPAGVAAKIAEDDWTEF